jgi:putative ABC transport system permease protein
MSWRRFLRRRYWDAERSRELQAYLQIEIDENLARGMPHAEASSAARRKLGNPFLIREEIYRMNSIGLVESLWRDIRYGARSLRLKPGFTIVAITSLALGIGANTAIFQLLDAVRLRTLPVRNPQELAEVHVPNWNGRGISSGSHPEMTTPLWEQVRDHQQAFSGMFAWARESFNLAPGGEARPAQGMWVTGDFFRVLGVPPMLGRVFTPEDDRPGCGSAGVVISYPFWQREFGGQVSAVGKKLTIAGHPFEILGITPPGFFGIEVGTQFDVAVPLCAASTIGDDRAGRRDFWWLAVVGRLKPGWGLARASAHLRSISPGLFEVTAPTGYAGGQSEYLKLRLTALSAATGFSGLREVYETPLWLLLAIAGLVLLIACANLANLMLARATAREREIAVRMALGASRGNLVRQLLTESLLLAGVGAALGAALAQGLSRFLIAFLSTDGDPLFIDLVPDWRVLAFTTGLALLTCVLFGLTPALRATSTTPSAAMKSGGRGLTGAREGFGLRRLLVVAQVSLSLVLLVGALLFIRSLQNLLTVDTGFRQDGVLVANLDASRIDVPEQRALAMQRQLMEGLRAIPGVEAVATASIIPLRGESWTLGIEATGAAEPKETSSKFSFVSKQYFKTMGMAMLAGRDFNDYDTPTAPRVAIVNQEFARQFFHSTNPLGKTFRTITEPNYPATIYQIVGLVKNTKYQNLDEQFKPIVFAAASQFGAGSGGQLLIRSNAPLVGLIPAVKGVVDEVSPKISINFTVLKTQIRHRLLPERLMATLSGFFGFLAALLATIGLYGVMSYTVVRRTNEIGIRMALGADGRGIAAMVLREALLLLGAGVTIGIGLALALGRTASSLLFNLKPYDAPTMGIAIAAMAAVATIASYLPARRAAGLDPMTALRDE